MRFEAYETLKDLNYKPPEDSLQLDTSDWITTVGMAKLVEE